MNDYSYDIACMFLYCNRTNDTPVHIGKLLAMDYQKEWVEDNKKRLREERIKQQVSQ